MQRMVSTSIIQEGREERKYRDHLWDLTERKHDEKGENFVTR